MKAAAPKWPSEAAMLTAFMAEARAIGFRVVPEACGHDIILVATEDMKPIGYGHIPDALQAGDVIAVEGKLRPSVEVLRQALPPHRRGNGGRPYPAADFYAVVVPDCDGDFRNIADGLDVAVWRMTPPVEAEEAYRRQPAMLGWYLVHSARVVGHPPLDVPTLDVDLPAGVPAPRQLTPWKIAAVRLCLLGLTRELTTADFETTPVRPRSFTDRNWMELVGRDGRSGVYRLRDETSRPDRVYPEIVTAIQAEGAPLETPRAKAPAGSLFVAGGVG